MNTSQVSGMTKNIVGKFQESIGRFFGNKEQQMTGRQKQSMGAAEKNLGDARELIKNAFKQMQRSKQAIPICPASNVIISVGIKISPLARLSWRIRED